MRLKDKVCIITGSSMGIGETVAERFAEEGAKVVVNSRSQERADIVAAKLKEKGYDVIAIACDMANKKDVERLMTKTVEVFGKIDVLVNNAGVNRIAPSMELSEEDWRAVIDTNLTGVFFGAQEAAKFMEKNGGGSIVNITSIWGSVVVPMRAAYSSTKHGMNGLTKVLAVEWAEKGIRVNGVAPAFIKTPLDDQDQDSGGYGDEDIMRRTPLKRFGTTKEVADVILFLASDEASYVTGTTYTVDGGWLAYGGW
ncbi:SDR family NAD(P)-dependent oxidoreductase [Alkalihalobacterium alkalinitrilicum]|uniref:SDR family NAD(P)-dependent oxidoreductase n=1 Tax=Alkalihalobacterium alkalinitrilicum TaxID=427920 RepID=UPI001C585FFF|nr:SDR family NAD(P)-dependent oxidoreductase [Alkalihalobacterium alkalinitrilicum]